MCVEFLLLCSWQKIRYLFTDINSSYPSNNCATNDVQPNAIICFELQARTPSQAFMQYYHAPEYLPFLRFIFFDTLGLLICID
jgi:hypothetical protein